MYASGSDMADEGVGAYESGSGMAGEGAVWRERELDRMRTRAIYRRRHIIRNAFVHNFIVIAVVRKAFHCVIAEKWLKRNYTMNGRDKQGEDGGVKERLKVREKIKNVKRLALVSCEIVDLVCSRL